MMELIKDPDKEETAQIKLTVSLASQRRYQAQIERAQKQRINLPKSLARQFDLWLDEVEAELTNSSVRPLRGPAKATE
jgi:hypothetical protein